MTMTGRAASVAEVMTVNPIVIRSDATLTEAARLMDEHRISGLPVVDRAGSLVGVLSQTDLARARATEYLWSNWPGLAVRHLMTQPAVTVHGSVPLALAIAKMERLHIHRLVVVDERDDRLPVGVLSLTDIVHRIADEKDLPSPAGSEASGDA